MAKQSPLSKLHAKNGARFAEYDGWSLPSGFDTSEAEYNAVRFAVGLLDLSDRALVNFTGPDRLSYLQGMLSNDLRPLSAGQGVCATVLNVQGKVIGDCRVFCTEDSFLLEFWEPIKQKVLEHLNRYLVADEVEITDEAEQYATLSVQGPRAEALLRHILPDEKLPGEPLEHRVLNDGEFKVRITRFNHFGESGFDLFVPMAGVNPLAVRLTEEGRAFSAKWIGVETSEVVRVEAGIPRYSTDFTEDTLLLEAGLPHAVSFQKGCYLGQEIVERIRSRGHVNKKLCGLSLKTREPALSGEAIRAGDKTVGTVTSSVYSPALETAIALGYIHKDFWEPGTALLLQRDDSVVEASVTSLPFVVKKGT